MRLRIKYITLFSICFISNQLILFSQSSAFKTEKMPFSKPYFNDIAPVIVKNGVIFCSDRRINSSTNITTFNGERLYNLYFVEKIDSTKWKTPIKLKVSGSSLLYYGPVSIASDGHTVYFTSSIISGKAARKKNIINRLGIFTGELSGNIISNVTQFEYNSMEYNVAHPNISRDGKFLFFASDMPGGQGQSDIYYCELINNKWSTPKNLGSNVNSPSKENYPFLHPSGRLYFSSDRPDTARYLGGMDVYYTVSTDGEWDKPVPMPEPINSHFDDFALVATDDRQEGFFTRKTGIDDDIWKFTSEILRKADCPPSQPDSYCYEFLDENAIRFDTMPVPFKFQWDFGDGQTAEGIKVQHCYKEPGNYTIKLDIINMLTNEVELNEKTYELEITRTEQAYISSPDRCFEGEKVVFDADSSYLPGWSVSRYYWNFDDETIAIGSKVEKVFMKPGNYNVQLIITSAPGTDGKIMETCVSKKITVTRKP